MREETVITFLFSRHANNEKGQRHLLDPADEECPAHFLQVQMPPPNSPCCSFSAPLPCPPGLAWWRAPPTEMQHHRASWGQSPSPRFHDAWETQHYILLIEHRNIPNIVTVTLYVLIYNISIPISTTLQDKQMIWKWHTWQRCPAPIWAGPSWHCPETSPPSSSWGGFLFQNWWHSPQRSCWWTEPGGLVGCWLTPQSTRGTRTKGKDGCLWGVDVPLERAQISTSQVFRDIRRLYYLEVEDNGPYQPEDNRRPSICDVSRMNVNQFDLKQKPDVNYSGKQVVRTQWGFFCTFTQKSTLCFISSKKNIASLLFCFFCLFIKVRSLMQVSTALMKHLCSQTKNQLEGKEEKTVVFNPATKEKLMCCSTPTLALDYWQKVHVYIKDTETGVLVRMSVSSAAERLR